MITTVIPAKAGTQGRGTQQPPWAPAFAGVTQL
jgi:hypothetical protein